MKLIVDNNILFAIMQPQSIAAYIFFTARNIEWFAPNFLWVEYKEYETLIMTKSGLSEHEFEAWLKRIQARVTSVDLEEYKRNLRHAVKMIPDPGRTIYLDVNPAISVMRSIQTEPNKPLKVSLDFQEKVRNLYLRYAKDHRFEIIGANQNYLDFPISVK